MEEAETEPPAHARLGKRRKRMNEEKSKMLKLTTDQIETKFG